jgi:hypothetical protein
MTKEQLNKWVENSPYTEQEEVVLLIRKQHAEIEKIEKLMNFWKESYNELRTRKD